MPVIDGAVASLIVANRSQYLEATMSSSSARSSPTMRGARAGFHDGRYIASATENAAEGFSNLALTAQERVGDARRRPDMLS